MRIPNPNNDFIPSELPNRMEKAAQKALKKPRKARTIPCQGRGALPDGIACPHASKLQSFYGAAVYIVTLKTLPVCTQTFDKFHHVMHEGTHVYILLYLLKLKFQIFKRIRKIGSRDKFGTYIDDVKLSLESFTGRSVQLPFVY
jgi:hypothetical protein